MGDITIETRLGQAPNNITRVRVPVPKKLEMTRESEAMLRKSVADSALCGVVHRTEGTIYLRPFREEEHETNDEKYAETAHPQARKRGGSEAPDRMVAVKHFDQEAADIHARTERNVYGGVPPNGHKQAAFLSGNAEDDLLGFSIRVIQPSQYKLVCTSRLLNGRKFNGSATDGRMSTEWANAIRDSIHRQIFPREA